MTRTTAPEQPAAIPRPVQAARALLALAAVYHFGYPFILWADGHTSRADLTHSFISNGFLLVVSAVLVYKLSTGHRWARRPATFSQILSIITSAVMWPAGTALIAIVPVADTASLALVTLLWAPSSSRTFFTEPRQQLA